MTISENTQLSLLGISGSSTQPADINSAIAAPVSSPGAAPRLPEGWRDTTKHGPVFVSPSGKAWAVKLIGNKLENVIVDVSPRDFVGQSAIEKRKEAVRKSARRAMTRVSRTTPPILAAHAAAVATGEGLRGS